MLLLNLANYLHAKYVSVFDRFLLKDLFRLTALQSSLVIFIIDALNELFYDFKYVNIISQEWN